jgi:hypothetical protein
VEEEDTYARQLEDILNRESSGPRFEVLNFGLAGINAEVAMRRLKKLDAFYRPDLLVYGFTPNDIEGPGYEYLSTPGDRSQARFSNLSPVDSPSRLYNILTPLMRSIRESYWPSRHSVLAERVHNFLDNPAAWRDFLRSLDQLKKLGDHRNRCVQILIHTQIMHLGLLHPYAPIYDKVGQAARELGFGVTETLSNYRFRSERTLWVGDFDPHPNRDGHRILAQALADDLLALPDRCFTP